MNKEIGKYRNVPPAQIPDDGFCPIHGDEIIRILTSPGRFHYGCQKCRDEWTQFRQSQNKTTVKEGEYPEHDKIMKLKSSIELVGKFLTYLEKNQSVRLCSKYESDWYPTILSPWVFIYRFFDINLSKIDLEKGEMKKRIEMEENAEMKRSLFHIVNNDFTENGKIR